MNAKMVVVSLFMVLFGACRAHAQHAQATGHWDDRGPSCAGNPCVHIDGSAVVDGQKLTVGVSTVNEAWTDNVQGEVVAVVTMENGTKQAFSAQSEMNPGKGWPWNGPTLRGGSATFELPGKPVKVQLVRGWNAAWAPRINPFVPGIEVTVSW